jgi:hypothetical protein
MVTRDTMLATQLDLSFPAGSADPPDDRVNASPALPDLVPTPYTEARFQELVRRLDQAIAQIQQPAVQEEKRRRPKFVHITEIVP